MSSASPDPSATAAPSAKQVNAAGGLVSRPDHPQLVLVVHRPLYDDWTFPKGKRDPGETDEACALREVWEETGLRCTLGAELPSVTYADRKGRPKLVRYWAMTVDQASVDAPFVPNDEVDEIRWVTAAEARALLSYERDALVLDAVSPR